MTADEVLLVLNGLEPVDMSGWVFCVITDAPEDRAGGYWPFERGEVVVLAEDGREPFGEGRKPAKWDVGEAEFATLAEAVACRVRVLAGDWPRSYGED